MWSLLVSTMTSASRFKSSAGRRGIFCLSLLMSQVDIDLTQYDKPVSALIVMPLYCYAIETVLALTNSRMPRLLSSRP